MNTTIRSPGERLREARKRAGMTQAGLAAASGVSRSWIRKIEQDKPGVHPSIETVHRLAAILGVRTSTLAAGAAAVPGSHRGAGDWADVRDAIAGRLPPPSAPPTVAGVTQILEAARQPLAANHYRGVRAALPALIRDAWALGDGADAAQARSRVLNLSAWLLTMTRQWEAGQDAAILAAAAAGDRSPLDAAAAVSTRVWGLLRQGRLDEAGDLAQDAADAASPALGRATPGQLAAWGRLLLGVTNAAVRDNRPGEAEEALRLAEAAAMLIGREILPDASTTRTFGPASAAMIRAENAAILGQPQAVLEVAGRIPADVLLPVSASRCRHKLDVAAALTDLGRYPEAVELMRELRLAAPEWLPQQQYARDILARVVRRRRTLTRVMRDLASAIDLPL